MKRNIVSREWYDEIKIDHSYNIKLDFAVHLENALKKSSISKAELAQRINKSAPWISKVLRGDANLTINTMCELAKAIGYKLHICIEDEGNIVEWNITPNKEIPIKAPVTYLHDVSGFKRVKHNEELSLAA